MLKVANIHIVITTTIKITVSEPAICFYFYFFKCIPNNGCIYTKILTFDINTKRYKHVSVTAFVTLHNCTVTVYAFIIVVV